MHTIPVCVHTMYLCTASVHSCSIAHLAQLAHYSSGMHCLHITSVFDCYYNHMHNLQVVDFSCWPNLLAEYMQTVAGCSTVPVEASASGVHITSVFDCRPISTISCCTIFRLQSILLG